MNKILFLDVLPDKAAMMYPVVYISSAIEEGVKTFSSDHWMNEWVTESTGSYAWMVIHLKTLCEQYTHHTGVVHESKVVVDEVWYDEIPVYVSHGALSSFPLDLPDEYREVKFDNGEIHMLNYVPMRDAVKLYREYTLTTEDKMEMTI